MTKLKSSDHTSSSSSKNYCFATGSKDTSIRLWNITSDNLITPFLTLNGHINSIECLAVSPSHNFLLSADWSGNLFAWDLSSELFKNALYESTEYLTSSHNSIKSNKSNKKAKTESDQSASHSDIHNDSYNMFKPLISIHAHAQNITGLQVLEGTDAHVLTVSWDRTMKQHDVETQVCVHAFPARAALTSLDAYAMSRVLTSDTSGAVRLWDLRTASGEDLGACTRWISQVRLSDAPRATNE
jgi:WD40 repeat protein